LQDISISEDRREDLIKYVSLVNTNLISTSQETNSRLDGLVHQLQQFEAILGQQQTFQKVEHPLESVSLKELVDDAVNMMSGDLRKHITIEISPAIEDIGPIMIQRSAILQVINNILINAAEAFAEYKPLYPKISVEAQTENADNTEMVHIGITDNAVGIKPDKIKQIFQRGVSSKQKGLTGIGLHWCANTISAMNGKIYAESPGSKCGACFHILLPCNHETAIPASDSRG